MREILLFLSIVIGQLAPNSQFYSQITAKARGISETTGSKTVQKLPDKISLSPIKTAPETYAADALSVYSIDLSSNRVLAEKEADERLQVASLTKLMTVYVVLKSETNLDKVVTVPPLNMQLGDSVMGLASGDQITIRNLLKGLLITSGSDAAQTLAISISGSMEGFVDDMNAAAKRLNFNNTHFANPVGWDDPNNFSSAKDLAELTRILLRNQTFEEIVNTKNAIVFTESGRAISLVTTNQLLSTPGYIGVKTGYTFGAGECLISLYQNGNNKVLTTVIGSSARFYETESIKAWILNHFSW